MKLSELMKNHTPNPDYEGFVTNDDFVLAMDCTEDGSAASPAEYDVVQLGVAGLDAQMNPITQDKTYIRAGQSTTKTGTQRSFAVSGDRYVGDAFQDFVLGHAVKYGTGNAVIRPYVYFCLLNGKGEEGRASVIVNSDASGNAGIDVEIRKSGDVPAEYTYANPNPPQLAALTVKSAAGADAGKTKLTVTPAKASGNSYQYKTAASVAAPAYDADCSTGYTAWDGTAEVAATTGQKILVVEVTSGGRARAAGIATVAAKE